MRPRTLATLLTLILALALGAGGPARAFAHGHDASSVAMVICGEDSARTLYLDAVGHPVEPGEICTDLCNACLPSGTAILADQPPIPAPEHQARVLASLSATARRASRRSRQDRANGLPTGVDLA